MPLYDYVCRACEKIAEVRHGFKETYDKACEACGGEMKRVFSATGIVFKGSGFYINDSRKASSESSSGSKSDGGAKSDGAKSDGAKSDGAKSDGAKSDGAKADSGAKSESSSPPPAKSDTAA